MRERVIMTRLLRGRAPGREFDIAFWQAMGPRRILEAAWDLVVTAAATRGVHEDQLRLQRSVTRLERGRRPLPDRGGYAVMVHTEPRYTKDLDLWIEPVESNAQKLFVALPEPRPL